MMLKNYIKIAWRNIIKNRLYSFINIFGLTIGFTGSLLITIYVIDELSYDNFHENGDQIYRVLREFDLPDLKSAFQYTPSALAPTVQESISGVDKVVRVQPYSETVRVNEKSFIESSFIMADDGFFDVFDFNIVEGKAELEQPNTLVISKTMAEKYFGNESPVGKMLSIGALEMEVTGVIADVPRNSHLQFHFVTATPPQQLNWGRNNFITYLLLDPNQSADLVTNQIAELINVNTGQSSDAANHDFIPHLQPLEGVHFGTGVSVSITAMGNIAYVYLFIALACFILVLACVNFINLTTARSVEKSREVGIRKTLGGQRTQIIIQFLGEAVLLSAIAACIALAIAQFSLPLLSSIAGKSLGMNSINSGFIWFVFGVFVLSVGILAGFYPSLVVSRYQPSRAVKGVVTRSGINWFRNGLVVFQFVASISILISTGIVYKQLQFMKSTGLGFNPDEVLLIEQTGFLGSQVPVLKEELTSLSGVQEAASGFSMPGTFFINSMWQVRNRSEESYNLDYTFVDFDYLKTLEIELVAGRDFSSNYSSDSMAVILNETAASEFGWSPVEAIGQEIYQGSLNFTVIGVAENFHYESLHSEIYPVALFGPIRNPRYIAVKTSSENTPETIASMKIIWEKFSDLPFEYTFLSDFLSNQYQAEDRLSKVFGTFSLLAILLACIGLLGLSSYMISTRTKEIGIRKVLGARESQIILLLNKQLLYLLVLATLVAIPASGLIMQNWLANFPYRASLGAEVFLISVSVAFLLALITVSYHSLKAASVNPVETLKSE